MFLPSNIDLGKSENYALTLRISPDSLAFAIYEPCVGGNYCYRETSFTNESDRLDNVQRIVFDYNFLTLSFKQTNVVFASKGYDVVPHYVYESKMKDALYRFTHQAPIGKVLECPKTIQNHVVLFDIDPEMYKFLMRSLYNPQFYHHSYLLMKYIEGKNRMAHKGSKMYLNFHNEFLDVFCYNDASRLVHATTFQSEDKYNAVYFILNLWDKCNFDQKEDYLYVLENFVGSGQSVISMLSDYIEHTENIGIPSEVELMGEDSKSTPLDLLILATL